MLSTWLTFKVDYECRPTLVEFPAAFCCLLLLMMMMMMTMLGMELGQHHFPADGAGWRQVKCFHYESLS